MKKKKGLNLELDDLKIQSFVTSFKPGEETVDLKGGAITYFTGCKTWCYCPTGYTCPGPYCG